jgi:RNA ligase (TIGR02306 family)
MRKLATIRRIDEINPIPNADAIEVATVGGWRVVVKKGEFAVGDLAVYCEIDSWIPHDLAPFLSKGNEPKEYNGVKGERLRTIRLRGQLSQGLLLPRHVVLDKIGEIHEGMDVTDLLGIQKFEPPIPAQLAGEVLGMFPSAVPKTDQERIQNLSAELATWQGMEFEVTEKLDGTSCTFYLDADGELHVCSRNLDLKRNPDNTLWRIADKKNVAEKMRAEGLTNYAIQGEVVGEGIQGNKYNLKGQEFFVFDIYDVATGRYLSSEERILVSYSLGLCHAPYGRPFGQFFRVMNDTTVQELLSMAEDNSALNRTTEREGLVFKCTSDTSIHFKAISNKFLLKSGE